MVKNKSNEAVEPRLTSSAYTETPTAQEEVDYLRQYQVRKQTKAGSPESDPVPGSKAFEMKKRLLKQERIRILIPRPSGEDKSIMSSVTLNGYRLDLPKNTYIDLPIQIADVIVKSQKQTQEAIMRSRIDGDKSKENALR